jgi:hypothetical protein
MTGSCRLDTRRVEVRVLRNAEAQASLRDATIECWDGSAWEALTATPVSTARLRLGRDFGSGPNYVYVHFDAARGVKLSQAAWQASYQSRNRLRNVHIDLRGEPSNVHVPAKTEVGFSIRTDSR